MPERPLHGGPAFAGEEARLVEAATAFAREVIAPGAAGWERDRVPLPRAVHAEWAALGLNALQVPRELGGWGASYLAKIAIAETVARTCLPSTFALINAQGSATRIAGEGSDNQKARWLPGLMSGDILCAPSLTEPGAGSDFAAIATRAVPAAGGWRITGTKAWVTNGASADALILYAQTEPGSGARGIASFLVDLAAPGVERHAPTALFGAHAIGAADIALDGVFVPERDELAPPGVAFKRGLAGVTGARIHVAAMCCGLAAGTLARAVDHGGERQAFGRPIIANQGLRWSLADVATELEAARGLVWRAARLYDKGMDAVLEAAQAKRFATDMALRAVTASMGAMGARGMRDDEPFGRGLAAARVAGYVDGTTEMQRERIGAFLARRYGGNGE